MRDYRIVCYDFETTGVETSFCRPTEFAAIIINPDLSRTEVSFLIKNKEIKNGIYEKLSEKVIEITNITDEMLEKYGIELDDAVQKIAEVMDVENKLGVRTIIMGHNIINFDNLILARLMNLEILSGIRTTLETYNITKYDNLFIPQLMWADNLSEVGKIFTSHDIKCDESIFEKLMEIIESRWKIDPKNVFDTGAEFIGELIGAKLGESSHDVYQKSCLKSFKRVKWNLTAACKYYGVQRIGEAHRALADVSVNLEVALIQFERLREKRKREEMEKKSEEAKNGQISLFS